MKKYKLTAIFLSDWQVSSGGGLANLFDKVCIKNAAGVVYLPGSTVKGRIKSYCKRLALTLADDAYFNSSKKICQSSDSKVGQHNICTGDNVCVICKLFGSAHHPGKLYFSDLKLDKTVVQNIQLQSKLPNMINRAQETERANVSISRYTRISEQNHLITSLNAKKSIGSFSGTLCSNTELSSDEEKLIRFTLKCISHLGNGKARGLGKVKFDIEELKNE